jgi:F-type H+-transporting ATPase subunit b
MDYKASPHLIRIFDLDLLHIELNTALFVLALVLVLMVALNRLLFRPVLRTLDNRVKLVKSLQEAAAGQREQMDVLAKQYEARLAAVRAEVARVRQESSRETVAQVEVILGQARKEAQADLQAALTDLNAQVQAAKQELGEAARRLADQTTQRILQA